MAFIKNIGSLYLDFVNSLYEFLFALFIFLLLAEINSLLYVGCLPIYSFIKLCQFCFLFYFIYLFIWGFVSF